MLGRGDQIELLAGVVCQVVQLVDIGEIPDVLVAVVSNHARGIQAELLAVGGGDDLSAAGVVLLGRERQRPAVLDLGMVKSQPRYDRIRDVHTVGHERVAHARLYARHARHQRHAADVVIEHIVLVEHIVAAAHIAVIGREHDDCVVLLAGALERVEYPADRLIELAHNAVIARNHILEVVLPCQSVRIPAERLLPVAVGLVVERIAAALPHGDGIGIVHRGKRRGRATGQMRLLIIDPDVPGLARGGKFFDHFAGARRHPVRAAVLDGDRAFAAHPAAGVGRVRILLLQELLVTRPADPFVVAERIGMQRGGDMEAAEIGGVIAFFLQLTRPAPFRLNRGRGHEIVVPLRAERIGMPSAQYSLPGGGAHGQRRKGAAVDHALRRQTIEGRGFDRPQPSVSHAVMPQLIGIDEQEIHNYLSQGVLMRETSPCMGGSISGTTSAPPFS